MLFNFQWASLVISILHRQLFLCLQCLQSANGYSRLSRLAAASGQPAAGNGEGWSVHPPPTIFFRPVLAPVSRRGTARSGGWSDLLQWRFSRRCPPTPPDSTNEPSPVWPSGRSVEADRPERQQTLTGWGCVSEKEYLSCGQSNGYVPTVSTYPMYTSTISPAASTLRVMS